jgi:hypothetical protein
LALAAVVVFGAGLVAQKAPDFSGTWTLDASKSEMPQGRGPMAEMGGGMREMTVVVKQTPNALTIEQQMANRTRTVTYKLDGSESTNPGMREAQVKSTSKWSGETLVTESTQTMEGPRGAMTIKSREVRSLAADGTMVVETTRETPRGKMQSKLVFRKAT